mmetsp:Transcript_98596/g.279427  ORF Transcript_98596/g.279427 Transcript_98596/m.279427 type:complete len:436 (-) Transcript_98596:2955-4262(-)
MAPGSRSRRGDVLAHTTCVGAPRSAAPAGFSVALPLAIRRGDTTCAAGSCNLSRSCPVQILGEGARTGWPGERASLGHGSLLLLDLLVDAVQVPTRWRRRHGRLRLGDGRAHGVEDRLEERVVEVRREDDAALPHALDGLVGRLVILHLGVVLDELREDVADADGGLDLRHLEHLLADRDHLLRVALPHLPDARVLVDDADPVLQYDDPLVVLRVRAGRLLRVLQGLVQRLLRLLVVAVLVDLDLGTGIIERGELVMGLRLAVELDYVLHDVVVVVPVEALQVVPGEHVDVGLARGAGEEDDLLGVAALEQALHRLQLVPRLRELLAGELEGSLLLADLGHLLEDLRALRRVHAVLPRRHPLRHVLGDRHVVLVTEVDRLLVLVRDGQQVHRFVVLAVLHEKLGALGQDLGVAVGAKVVGDLPQRVKEAGGEADL